MTNDPSKKAAQILASLKARRPRWRNSTMKSAPSWFSGREIDTLQPGERYKLYRDIRSQNEPAGWVPMYLFAAMSPLILRGLRSEQTRIIWIGILFSFALILVGVWMNRRRVVLSTARRTLLANADWMMKTHYSTMTQEPDRSA